MRQTALTALVAVLAACATPGRPTPPTGVSAVAVAPVENKTGGSLVIAGDTYVERWLGRQKRTVPDAIARELQTMLHERGFGAAAAGAPKLTVVLQRFEPDLPQLSYVSVSLVATLTDPDGTVRWSEERTSWPVSTSGAVSLAAAYDTAARTVARDLVRDWNPAR
jgi:ABC-type uncharacterized transport system auxiliary subunit